MYQFYTTKLTVHNLLWVADQEICYGTCTFIIIIRKSSCGFYPELVQSRFHFQCYNPSESSGEILLHLLIQNLFQLESDELWWKWTDKLYRKIKVKETLKVNSGAFQWFGHKTWFFAFWWVALFLLIQYLFSKSHHCCCMLIVVIQLVTVASMITSNFHWLMMCSRDLPNR